MSDQVYSPFPYRPLHEKPTFHMVCKCPTKEQARQTKWVKAFWKQSAPSYVVTCATCRQTIPCPIGNK